MASIARFPIIILSVSINQSITVSADSFNQQCALQDVRDIALWDCKAGKKEKQGV